MKCLVLDEGSVEILWLLSRKNCPKQFIEIENNHSIFQDTFARNIPYCDEFIIVSNVEYRYLIENQLDPFQGLNYRCLYKKVGKKTTAAITLRLVIAVHRICACDQYVTSDIRSRI